MSETENSTLADQTTGKTVHMEKVPVASGAGVSTAKTGRSGTESTDLYSARKKLNVRSIKGIFTNWRWALVWLTQIIFYGLPWLTWNGRQAVLFHLTERKFFLFGWVFWPQDVFFLAILLIISAYALFFFTTVAGRLWCGYACPQTVYTEIFMWIEEKIEGDHLKRRKLEQMPWNGRKIMLRSSKFLAWALVALWTGFTFAAYFSPLKELLYGVLTFHLGSWQTFWILFYAGFTYLFAGVMREQVCKYMCPYARFQSVMFDTDTLIVTYDEARGEPRGSRKKNIDPRSVGKGDCIDCNICVQVCPTGIDIRNGLQYECIGCGACIDACHQVMKQMNYPVGLIRYSTEHALEAHWDMKQILRHVARPRTMLYGTVLVLAVIGMLVGLAYRPDLRFDVLRDRAALAREVGDGMIENVYTLRIMNMVEHPRTVRIEVRGLDGLKIEGENPPLQLDAESTETVTLQLRAPEKAAPPGSHKIVFEIHPVDQPEKIQANDSTFYLPKQFY